MRIERIREILFLGSLLFISPTFIHANAIPPNTTEQSIGDDNSEDRGQKVIIGRSEHIHIEPGNLVLEARVDTGATTTSLGVDEIQIVEEDGVKWAEIKIDHQSLKLKVIKFVRIKRHGAKSIRRAVVRLRLTLGNVSETVNVTLSNRTNYKFPMLIGRNFLYDHFIVDVSLENTMPFVKNKAK